jgi:hypothetical protein
MGDHDVRPRKLEEGAENAPEADNLEQLCAWRKAHSTDFIILSTKWIDGTAHKSE